MAPTDLPAASEVRIRFQPASPPRILSVAGATEALFGYAAAALRDGHADLLQRIHADDRDVAAALFGAGEPPAECNLRVRHADGRIRCLSGTCRVDGDGRELILADARGLRRAAGEPAMTANFRAMMENTDDFIYFKDRHHVLTGASQTLAALVEGTAHWTDLIGRTDYDIFPEALADRYYVLERQVLAGAPVACEIQAYRTRDGRTGWVDNRKYPIRDAAGAVVGLFGVARDVTAKLATEQALRQEQETLQLILDYAPIGIWLQDGDGRLSFVNKAFCQAMGIPEAHALEVPQYVDRIPESFRRQCLDLANIPAAGPDVSITQQKLAFPDGQVHDLRVIRAVKRGPAGQPAALVGLSLDVTEELKQQYALRESEERLRLALAASKQAWFDVELPSGRVAVSVEYPRMIGYEPEGFQTDLENWFEHIHPDDRETVASAFLACIEHGGPYSVEYRRMARTGTWKWLRSIGKIARWSADGRATRMIGIHADITPLKEHERRLEHIAHYDGLTDLPNRVLLADRLHLAMAQAHRRGQKLAVAYIDLDGFKQINDSYGHAAGDRLLVAVATSMRRTLREGDTLARLGGDEFVAVLIDLPDVAASLPMLGRLLGAASEPVTDGALRLQVSASIGVTFYPQAEEVDADQLLRQADQAMYQSKLAGKNHYHLFDAEQDRSVRGRHESLARIRQGLADGEFTLRFQPKVHLRNGVVVGAEALIRWQHPERGLLLPALFLPLIEAHPLDAELGEWVIDQVLGQIGRWRAIGLDLPVSVNVSAYHLQRPDFVERLRTLLARHPEVPADRLVLEVLESSALVDLAQAARVLDTCREIGVSFALDDFGTGYSSLTYLKRLAVAQIKIDQSFVRDMLDDPEDLAILEGILGLASAFRRLVVAEGVETVEHGIMLLQLGCEIAQGYGIARPMPAADLPAWSADWRPDPIWSATATLAHSSLPLLHAGVEYRAWSQAIEAALKSASAGPPPPDPERGHLGVWLAEALRAGRLAAADVATIRALQKEFQSVAAAITALQAADDHAAGQVRLADLRRCRDDLLARLGDCMQAA
ncbi:EAL domain-containing protein [Parasulfuritortus cantonensis]|uniref:EAL domain-containing protein n=1 Tax=Parasulfuritortus cantonensis TaxID=2528202 RepID=A0A4R1BCF3_9PROT|nr:EAL domain-containing protein [Parasulfuritortus cantonensis]TCJ14703.1 EAL domain-containing protein [Parasulfuritortus cantonensis]